MGFPVGGGVAVARRSNSGAAWLLLGGGENSWEGNPMMAAVPLGSCRARSSRPAARWRPNSAADATERAEEEDEDEGIFVIC